MVATEIRCGREGPVVAFGVFWVALAEGQSKAAGYGPYGIVSAWRSRA